VEAEGYTLIDNCLA